MIVLVPGQEIVVAVLPTQRLTVVVRPAEASSDEVLEVARLVLDDAAFDELRDDLDDPGGSAALQD